MAITIHKQHTTSPVIRSGQLVISKGASSSRIILVDDIDADAGTFTGTTIYNRNTNGVPGEPGEYGELGNYFGGWSLNSYTPFTGQLMVIQ